MIGSARTHVSNEARGIVRVLIAALTTDAERMTRAANKIPAEILNGSSWRGKVGAERAIERIVRGMPRPPDFRNPKLVMWLFLEPTSALPVALGGKEEPARAGITMKALIAAHKKPGRRVSLFGFAASLHALHRCCDRSNFAVDPVKAMYSAHTALACLAPAEGAQIFELAKVVLPTPGGTFLATTTRVGIGQDPLCVAKTWIGADQTHQHQDADLSAWARLLGLTSD
jgi:hypothetical protein